MGEIDEEVKGGVVAGDSKGERIQRERRGAFNCQFLKIMLKL